MDAHDKADEKLLDDLRRLNFRSATAAADRIDELLVENRHLRRSIRLIDAANAAQPKPLFNPTRQPVRFIPAEPAPRRRLAHWRKR